MVSPVWPQNQWQRFLRFGLKTGGNGFSSLASKPVVEGFEATISWLSLKTKVMEGFPVWASKPAATVCDLGLKITMTVSWFGPQNQAGFGLSVSPRKIQ
jgi:hypothetical protein